MKKIHLLLITALVFGLFSCQNDKSSETVNTELSTEKSSLMHVGEWHVTKMNMAGEEVLPGSIGSPVYTFKEDNTYIINLSGQTETGTYTIDKDLMVLTASNSETIHDLKLLELTATNMTYEVGDEFKTVVSLKK